MSQREDHVQLGDIARRKTDVVVTTANFPHYIRRRGLSALPPGGALPHVKQVQMFRGISSISSKHNKCRPFRANCDLLLFGGEVVTDKREMVRDFASAENP
jgi:hypothetical protein